MEPSRRESKTAASSLFFHLKMYYTVLPSFSEKDERSLNVRTDGENGRGHYHSNTAALSGEEAKAD